MLQYVLRRLIYSIPILIIASVVVFLVAHATADPLAAIRRAGPQISKADVLRAKKELGLDKSQAEQYWIWLTHFLRGDWGHSLLSARSVFGDLRTALANSLLLGLFATTISLFIGTTVGIYSAVKQYSAFDHISTGTAFFGISIPNFWFALLLQLAFGVYLVQWFHLSQPWLYTAGMYQPGTSGFSLADRLRHIGLPAIVLAVQIIAVYSRYMRSSMLEVLHSDYMRTARAKGLTERRVIVHHGARNALIPLTTQVAIDVGTLAGGLIVTESIFQWPGMGPLFLSSFQGGDYPMVLAWTMIVVTFVIVFNLIADILYAVLDPRIRYA